MVLAPRFFSLLLKTGLKLPDISALNGTAIDSVAEFDGLTISGGAPAVSAPAAAYSVRLLDSAVGISSYTGAAMRVRRVTGTGNTGNDDEADVAFDTSLTEPTISLDSAVSNFSAGGSNATTLGQFLNVGTVGGTTYTDADSLAPNTAAAYVDEWKDQSGNANHATQGTPSNQPQIHSGLASTDLILENGKPAIASTISTSLTMSSTISVRSLFSAQKSTLGFLMGYSSGAPYHANGIFYLSAAFADSAVLNGNNYENSTLKNFTNVTRSTSQVVVSMIHTGTVSANQISQDRNTSNSSLSGTRQELILWSDDQSSNRTGIEQNINSEFLIYQPTDAPTSGLLATYTGAAAAYSVRQLSDKAVICMRIRRDMGAGNPGDDDETNIGFDANGDLDTQAIADFCGTGTGYVTRWWDQSVNGNHADQPVGGTGSNSFQPQIYNGTAVITENGKPALNFDGLNDVLISPTITVTDGELLQSAVFVADANAGGVVSCDSSPVRVAQTIVFQTTTLLRLLTFNSSGGVDNAISATANATGTQTLVTSQILSGQGEVFVDGSGTLVGTFNVRTDATTIQIAKATPFESYFDGRVQEVLHWPSQQTNRTGIETDINTYFSIYT